MTAQIAALLGWWTVFTVAIIFTGSILAGWITGQLDGREQRSCVSDIAKEEME